MTMARVPVHRTSPTKTVLVEAGATVGAVFGVNLKWPDGRLVQPGDFTASAPAAGSELGTTDDLDEGQWNLWFTPRRAQDAVGAILADSANVTLRYVAGETVTADLTDLADSGAGALLATSFDAKGRKTGTRAVVDDDLPGIDATAGTDLGAPRAVAVADGVAYYPDLTNPADVLRLAGFTAHAAAAGAPVRVLRQLVASEPAWAWLPGSIYITPAGGQLTQSPSPTAALVHAGVVVDAHTVSLRFAHSPITR